MRRKKAFKKFAALITVALVTCLVTFPAFAQEAGSQSRETAASAYTQIETAPEAGTADNVTDVGAEDRGSSAGTGQNLTSEKSSKAMTAALCIAVVAAAGAIAMGWAISKSVDSISRQPEAESKIRTALMLGLVFIETAIIYALVVAILIIFVL